MKRHSINWYWTQLKKFGLYDLSILALIVTTIAFYDVKLIFLGMQAIAFVVTGLRLVVERKIKDHVLFYVLWILAFCGYSLISCLWARSGNTTAFLTTLSTVQVGLIAACILVYAQNKRQPRVVIDAFLAAAILICIRFVLEIPASEWFTGRRFSTDTIFGGNVPALVLSYAAVIALWRCFFTKRNSKFAPVIYLLMTAIFVLIPLLMGTKKCVLIIGVAVLVFLLANVRSRKELGIRIGIFAGIAFVVYVAVMYIPFLYRSIGYRFESLINALLGEGSSISSSAVRLRFLADSWEVFLKNPIFGVGQDGYRYLSSVSQTYSHCNYTELLANLGLVGFVAYYWFYIWLLKRSFQIRKTTILPFVFTVNMLIEDISLVSYSFECRYVILTIAISAISSVEKRNGEDKMLRKITGAIRHPGRILQFASRRGWLSWMPDKIYQELVFRLKMGYRLNLENPRTYNEKLQWLKLYDRNPKYTQLVDKYAVRQYIADKLGEEYLIPLLGVWDRFEDIDFGKLPNQFVLKCTHDSTSVIICLDKTKFNIETAKKKLNRCLKNNGYNYGREWPYKNVKPRIIAEKYMVDESGYELKDYKFFCFNGEVKAMFVAKDRTDHSVETKFDFFDPEFEHLDLRQGHPNSEPPYFKPDKFKEMKQIARTLSQNIPHVRVDLYNINGKIYFGELTFFHYSGFVPFDPPEWDLKFGNDLNLPMHE